MRILLTNDDGVDAPGLDALDQSVRQALRTHLPDESHEILVVAPDRGRSECSHSIETRDPLHVSERAANRFALNGTPVDCIRVAAVAMGFRPDVVFSGINAGANLGVNLMVSGTFAAAREAALLGFPAMAISHYRRPDVPRTWDHTARWLDETLGDFLAALPAEHPMLWNVNLPAVLPESDVPERVSCQVDRRPIARTGQVTDEGAVEFELDFHGRPREPDRDVAHCFAGRITVSSLTPFLTETPVADEAIAPGMQPPSQRLHSQ